ncbi:MAG: ATP-binding cassette domain-containing protein [Idiomarina sp.]|nr:ATP-binding cassette domain-containing protein [Idiomarina sp.]
MLLDIRNLTIFADTPQGEVRVLDRVSLQVAEGEIHTLVGESGSGKSLVARAIMGFVNSNWRIQADRLWFRGTDLLNLTAKQRREIIGVDIAMIFQDPIAYLDPNATVIEQLREAIPAADLDVPFFQRRAARDKYAAQLLVRMGIRDHQDVLASYPFELSDGVAQKVMIATALAHRPYLLIADEPTTTMEPVMRAQIYKLLAQLHARYQMSILMITQDLATIMPETSRITTIYCGQVMESGPLQSMLTTPQHPYTDALSYTSLFQSERLKPRQKLATLAGLEPTLQHMPIGCRLGPRCPNAQRKCVQRPELEQVGKHQLYCHYPISVKENAS